MFLKYQFGLSFAILANLFFSGCVGTGIMAKNEQIEPGSLYDLTSSAISPLELMTVDSQTLNVTNTEGNFVRNNGSASVLLSQNLKNINQALSAQIPPRNLTHFVTIIPQGNSYNGHFGLIGIPSNSFNDKTTGSYTYEGNAEVFINDGTALYGLTGNSLFEIQFGNSSNNVTGEINTLTGKRSFLDLSCRDCNVSDVVQLQFENGTICNGSRICFSTINLGQNTLSADLSDSYDLVSDGTFFGSDLSEIGGVFSVSDTNEGSIEMRGAFVGKQ